MDRNDRLPQGAILAIDDEHGFLCMLREALEHQGFQVHTSSSPREAIKLYGEQWQNIHVVLMDFMMPEMTGETVFECLQRLNPNVSVFLLTAHDEYVAEKMFQNGLRHYMRKPFSLVDLIRKVRDATNPPMADCSAMPLSS